MLVVSGYTAGMGERFRIEVRPSALGMLALYLAVGLMIGVIVTARTGSVDTMSVAMAAVGFTLLSLAAVIGHELGHAYVALTIGRPVRALVLRLGAGTVIETGPGRLGSVLVALGGPVASLMIAGVYFEVGGWGSSVWTWAGLAALSDALVNLLPASSTTDGARALAALDGRHS